MRTILLLVLVSISVLAKAGTTPDSVTVSKLYGTSWKLTGKYRMSGLFHRKHRVESYSDLWITIYKDEIHTALNTGKYQICASRHRNKNEFWLDCAQPDQFIYKVMKATDEELVIDVYGRRTGQIKHERVTRNYYTRKRD